ncbi:hypothetical protein KC318_g512, partial [Hortaea werneckii]
ETTQTELDNGEFAIRGSRHAMLELEVHVLDLWDLLENGKSFGCITLADVAHIDPLEKSPPAAMKLKNDIQSRLAQEYVQRLSDDEKFAAHEENFQPKRVEQMRAMVDFLRKKPTAFDRAGFNLVDPQKGQDNYAITLSEVTKRVLDDEYGDVQCWLVSCTDAMQVLQQNKLRCQSKTTFIHRSIVINASARLAEKLQQQGKDRQVWDLELREKEKKLRAMHNACDEVTKMMYTLDKKNKVVDVQSNYILYVRLVAVKQAYVELVNSFYFMRKGERRAK